MIKQAIRSGRKNYNYYLSTVTNTEFIELTKGNLLNPDQTKLDLPLGIVVLVKGGSPKWYEGIFEKDDNMFYQMGAIEFFGDEEFVAVVNNDTYTKISKEVGSQEEKDGAELPVIFMKYEALK